jgi:hypothetical protein
MPAATAIIVATAQLQSNTDTKQDKGYCCLQLQPVIIVAPFCCSEVSHHAAAPAAHDNPRRQHHKNLAANEPFTAVATAVIG